jgi:uncharacterized PurR-regulated membrane protein YhhQ (DUF165 family)
MSEAVPSIGRNQRILTGIALLAYAGTVPLANWMISNVGTQQFPDGPHTIPVGFGFDAPSGVLAIGVSLAARDAVHRLAGRRVALAAIAIGVLLSFVLASPALAAASAFAFALGELIDFAVYVPLSHRSLPAAILASGVAGAVVDSLVFLQIAFGSSMFWQGQVLGKVWVAGLAALAVAVVSSTNLGRDTGRSAGIRGECRS